MNKLLYTNYLKQNKTFGSLKKLNSLIIKDYDFLWRIYFTCNDKSQSMFAYQGTLTIIYCFFA